MKTNKSVKSWKEHIAQKYGEKGTDSREKFEEDFEAFRIGVLIQEARRKQNFVFVLFSDCSNE